MRKVGELPDPAQFAHGFDDSTGRVADILFGGKPAEAESQGGDGEFRRSADRLEDIGGFGVASGAGGAGGSRMVAQVSRSSTREAWV